MSIRGKYTGKKTPAETILKINLEAAHEVARQLSLRNLSGIIIVDFIDMESKEDQETLMRTLGEELSRDPGQNDPGGYDAAWAGGRSPAKRCAVRFMRFCSG